jgi:hypothetical protein
VEVAAQEVAEEELEREERRVAPVAGEPLAVAEACGTPAVVAEVG